MCGTWNRLPRYDPAQTVLLTSASAGPRCAHYIEFRDDESGVVTEKGISEMSWLKNYATTARAAAVVALGGLALTACASTGYVDEQIAAVNARIDGVDGRAQAAAQRAEAANTAAQSAATEARNAATAANAAATEARGATQRLNTIEGRVNSLESAPARTPRG